MLRSMGPTLLLLSLAVPTASLALGLGDIRVDSALHQPLVAQIELVGASKEELGRLSAAIASDEIFERYGLERAPFLYGTTLSVGQDSQGHPAINLRSTESFTEPVVTLLIDLHTPNGELIREYTVFLDPPGLESKPSGLESKSATAAMTPLPVAPAAAQTPTSVAAPERAAAIADFPGHTYTVARRDTLEHIASKAGAHSRTDRHRMMIAIFHANPAAFHNNFNRLHTGVTLNLPSAAQLAAISAADADREYDAQMAAWRAPDRRVAAAIAAPATSTSNSVDSNPIGQKPVDAAFPVDTKADTESQETDKAVLTQRVASLEKSIDQLRQQLQQPIELHATAPVAAATAPDATDEGEEEPAPAPNHALRFASLGVGIALVMLCGAWFYRRRRNEHSNPAAPHTESDTDNLPPVGASDPTPSPPQTMAGTSLPVEKAKNEQQRADSKDSQDESSWLDDPFSTPIADLLATTVSPAPESTLKSTTESTVKLVAARFDDGDTTAVLAPDLGMAGDTVEQKFSFFNPESANNTTHVVMGSGLDQAPPFVERRKNPADVLRQAIEREPERSDLRLKLLELYYTAAAENRRAFLDATRQLAKNDKLASPENWSRIADMGRTIAPDDELFCEGIDDKRVA